MATKKLRTEILVGLVVAVVGGIVVATYQFLLSSEEVKPLKSPKHFSINLKEFYLLDRSGTELMNDGDSSTYEYNSATKMGGFYLTSLFNAHIGIKKNVIEEGNTYSCDHYDIKSIQLASGISVYNSNVQQHSKVKSNFYNGTIKNGFAHYNPMIIRWATNHMIPNPNDKNIQGIRFQDMYNELYRNNIRVIAKSYLYFKDEKSYKNAQIQYLKAMKDPDFNGPTYLYNNYGEKKDVPFLFDRHMAIGFWLRRGIDGTNDEIWQCLSKVLRMYDRGWFNKNITIDSDI